MNHALSSRALTLLLLSLISTQVAAQGLHALHGEVVHAVGDAAPGIPGATIFATSNFDSPVLDQNGTMLYRARMTGAVTGADDRAYFIGRSNGDLQLVLRASDQAPGCLAGTLLRSSSASAGSVGLSGSPRISPFGEIIFFQSALYDPVTPANTPTTSDSALFWGPASGYVLLAREGEPVPFLAGAPAPSYGAQTFSFQNNAINSSGQALFSTTLVIGSGIPAVVAADDTVMVTGTPSGLSVVSRENDVLPGGEVVMPVSGAQTLSFIHQINEAGQVLHELRFQVALPSTATTANDRALAVWTGGTDTIIAREGQQAPGLAPGVLFATPALGWSPSVGGGSFTRSGNMMFIAALDGAGTTTVDDSALYYGGQAGWQLVLREGDLCPGLIGSETFTFVGNVSMMCNDAGQMTFIAGLAGASVTTANDSSLWVGTVGNLTMLAREGDNAPGLAPSVNGPWKFEQITQGTQTPYLTDRGHMLWQCSVTDGVTFSRGIWYSYTPALGMQMQLDSTDTFTTPLGNGAWTSISSPGNFNGGDGGPSWFNNNGDFVNRMGITGAPTAAIIRGHVGSLIAKPASISAIAGGTQNFVIDCSPATAFNIYVVLGSNGGTRPGTPSPLGPQNIPLNFGAWTQLSLDLANTPVYTNSLGFLDAGGKGTASFNLPPAIPGLQGLVLHHAVVTLDFSLTSTFVTEPTSLKLY